MQPILFTTFLAQQMTLFQKPLNVNSIAQYVHGTCCAILPLTPQHAHLRRCSCFCWHECQTQTIHAVSEVCGRRTISEHVSKVPLARATPHLHSAPHMNYYAHYYTAQHSPTPEMWWGLSFMKDLGFIVTRSRDDTRQNIFVRVRQSLFSKDSAN